MSTVGQAFPLLLEVHVHTFSEGADDGYGNTEPTFTPPLADPGVVHKVFGWWTPRSLEPKLAGHDRVITDVELCGPPGIAGPHDIVDLPGSGQFEVIGHPEDHNNNPWFQPGLVIYNLKRVEG